MDLASLLSGGLGEPSPEPPAPAHHSNYQPREAGKFRKGKPAYPTGHERQEGETGNPVVEVVPEPVAPPPEPLETGGRLGGYLRDLPEGQQAWLDILKRS